MMLIRDKFCKQKRKLEYPDQISIYDFDEFGNPVDRTYTVSVSSDSKNKSAGGGEAKKKVHKTKKTEKIHYDGLEVKVVTLQVTDDMKKCPECGAEMTLKGYFETCELCYQPGILYIKKIRQPKMECKACQEHNEAGKSTVVTAMEELGYDVELTYVKREENN